MKKKIKIKDIDCEKYDALCWCCPARLGNIYDEDTRANCIICKKDYPDMLDQEVQVTE